MPKDQKDLKPFINAYLTHEPLTVNIIDHLIPEMLDKWRFEALEYSKIFYYPFPSKEETELLSGIGRIVMEQDIKYRAADIELPKSMQFMKKAGIAREKDIRSSGTVDIRLPHVLKKLIHDEYIQSEEIVPRLPEQIFRYEDNIISHHYFRHLDMFRAFRTTPKILERIEDKFRINYDKSDSRTHGLMKPRNVNNLYTMTAKEIAQTVEEHSSNVFSADVPISGYSIILRLAPKEFLDQHVTNLILMLQMDFGKMDSKDFLATNGENFITGEALKSLSVDVSLDEKYAMLSFNRSFQWGNYKLDAGFMTYGVKLMMENYCLHKGINYYGEIDIQDNEKIFYIEKYNSALFAKENIERIRSELTPDNVLKIIDYSNHNHAFRADVDSISHCEYCGKGLIEGTFEYNALGYIIKDSDPVLKQKEVKFPLHQLHILQEHSENYNPKIYELEAIDQIIKQSKDWIVREISPELEKDYTNIMRTSADILRASIETDKWCENVHSTPDYTPEQLDADPELKKLVEMEQKIFAEPHRLAQTQEHSIDNIITYINNNYGGMSRKYEEWIKEINSNSFNDPQWILNTKLGFIESTYNTFKTRHALNPSPFSQRVIEAVETRYQELFPKHTHALNSGRQKSYIQKKPSELGDKFLY